MEYEYYPWGGEFDSCYPHGSIAVVLLNIDYVPPKEVAIFGHLKTENIGIEKIVANVISNPHIRFIIICGDEIRGHQSGKSLIALNENGIDSKNKIINAPGAIPYIENLDTNAINRFREQIKIVNLIGITDKSKIDSIFQNYLKENAQVFGDPFIAIRIKNENIVELKDKRALHSKIVVNYMGKIQKRSD